MTDKTIVLINCITSKWFKLIYSRKETKTLQDHLDKFNIEEYFIYKVTNRQRQVSIEDLYEFKYGGYILFKKDIFDKEYIDIWIEYLNQDKLRGIQYLSKPLPPFNPSKIIIKQ
jgi:hypothetical protein